MDSELDDPALLALAVGLAERAALAILAVKRAGFVVERKSDRSFVTAADRIAEAIIVDGLREAAPHLPVVAEEEVAGGLVTAPGEAYWLVDPLDGTREFARGTPHYAVHIGLVRGGVPVLGVVAVPEFSEVFWGGVELGAWKRDGQGERAIRVRSVPAVGMVVMGSAHHADDPRLAAWIAGRAVARVENIGSSIKMLRVAEGAADVHPRFHTTMEWDTAAPQAVLEAAGGSLSLWAGGALRYGKPGWENPGYLVTGAT
jgi:3'(2'), 5'-bisphosphate nucleotidase